MAIIVFGTGKNNKTTKHQIKQTPLHTFMTHKQVLPLHEH